MIVFSIRCRKEYFKIIAFDELAETTLCNGDRVEVKGKLRTSSYERDGVKHYGVEIIANFIEQEQLEKQEANLLPGKTNNETNRHFGSLKTESQPPEHGQRPVADFEGCPF